MSTEAPTKRSFRRWLREIRDQLFVALIVALLMAALVTLAEPVLARITGS